MPFASTLHELLATRAVNAPQGGYQFARDGEVVETLSFAQLEASARRLAARLAAAGATRGSRVLVVYPPGLEFIRALFGCFYAGATAVPVLPPNPVRLAQTMTRLRLVAADCDAQVVLTTSALGAVAEKVRALAPELARCRWVDSEAGDGAADPPPVEVAPGDVALLQYTSGSTRAPRGVVLSHANLIHNEELIRRAFGHRERDLRGVSWLPLYHDMGLIGMVLQPLYMGGSCLLMSPLDFLRKPLLWLSAISKTRANTSGAPNFAFDLAVRSINDEQRAELDLSCLEVMYCGSEPVRKATLDRFADRFAAVGFQPRVWLPCYGLAEATLLVSGQVRSEGPVTFAADDAALRAGRLEPAAADGRPLVGCGPPAPGLEVLVVKDGHAAPAGTVGEIWVRGDSVGSGYFGKPEESQQTFGARLSNGSGPFLRTGDLGAFDARGELYVVGRLKDLLIVRGLNHYPQDLEATVESAWVSLRPGSSVAFAVEGALGEEVVVVCEYEARAARDGVTWQPVVDAIRSAIAVEHELSVSAVVVVAAGQVPKTSSGKVQRAETRRRLLARELEVLHRWDEPQKVAPVIAETEPPRTPAELSIFIASWLSEVLKRSISPEASFASIGLDSLDAVHLTEALGARLGCEVSPIVVIDHPSIPTLAEYLAARIAPRDAPTAAADAAGEPRGDGDLEVPLLPEAARAAGEGPLSFTEERFYRRYLAHGGARDTGAWGLMLSGALDRERLRQAFDTLIARHAVLRSRYVERDGRVVRQLAAPSAFTLPYEDLSSLPEASRLEAVQERVRRVTAEPWDLARETPLLRARLYGLDAQQHALVVVMHHISFDFDSFRLLMNEVSELYRCLCTGTTPEPAPVLQYLDFAHWQRGYYVGDVVQRGRAWFADRVAGATPAARALPADRSWDAVDAARRADHLALSGAVSATSRVSAELMRTVEALCRTSHVDVSAMMLAALGAVIARRGRCERVSISTVMSARSRLRGAGQMLGNFHSSMPVVIDTSGGPGLVELTARVGRSLSEARQRSDFPIIPLVTPSISNFERAQFNFVRLGHPMRWGELEVAPIALRSQSVPADRAGNLLDLFVSIAVDPGGANVTVRLNDRVWEQQTAAQLAADLLAELTQAVGPAAAR